MNESGQNCIQNLIEALARVFRQETQQEISILLQQGIFPPIPPVRFRISQMLCSIQLNDDIRFFFQRLLLFALVQGPSSTR
jgi:hypothetical protein